MKLPLFFLLIITSVGLIAQDYQSAESALTNVVKEGKTAGVTVGILKDGEIKWTGNSGIRAEEMPMTSNTLLRIASIAKPMTATAVMQLVESGKIDLDASITAYLPAFPQWKDITTRQLLQHTSGISAYANRKEVNNTKHYDTLGDAVQIFSDRDLESVPGEEFSYTTYGYVVLGLLIERASGMTYAEYVRQHIFEKAGMENTFVIGETMDEGRVSSLYSSNGKGKISSDDQTDLSDRIPGGGILSTANDVLLFANAIINNELISEESFKALITNSGAKKEGNPYGMGWYLYGVNPTLGNTIGHTGGQAGCSAQLFVFPEKEAALVVISNTSNAMKAVSGLAVSMFSLIEE